MKAIIVKTKKIVSHKENGEPIYEEIEMSLAPELTFDKWLNYLPNQGFIDIKVSRVLDVKDKNGNTETIEIDEVDIYQNKINESLKPKQKFSEAVDYKALSEKQEKMLEDLKNRLEMLEESNKEEKKKAGRPKKED